MLKLGKREIMNVLITGSAGFLGSHLAKRFLDRGCRVVGVDNFSSSSRDSAHHRQLLANHNYLFIKHDITHDFKNLMLGFVPKLIFNFACPASPPIYQKIPIETLMTCTLGVKNVLDIAMACKSTLVHASTSEVYGDPTISPQPESYRGNVNCWGPRANYDEGKRCAETLIYEYQKFGVDARLVRIFNTYGPNMDPNDGRVVSNLLVQALKGEPLTIYGDGSQTRSFCYVDDLIDGIIKLAELDENPMRPINLGNPGEYTVLELANQVLKLTGKDLGIVNRPFPVDDPLQRKPDITLAREILGWEPKVNLIDGLQNTYDHFAGVLNVS